MRAEEVRTRVEAEMHRRLQEREGFTYLAQAAASEAQSTIQELSSQLHQAQVHHEISKYSHSTSKVHA